MGSLRYATTLFLLAAPLYGDALSDLRTTLTRLQGRSPIRGTAEYQLNTRTKDGKDLHEERGSIRVAWEYGNPGVTLKFDELTLQQAEREARMRRADPERPAPTRTALLSFSPLDISECIDASTVFLRELERGELLQAQRVGDQTLVIAKLPPRLSRPEQKHVRSSELRMKIWLDRDGIPVSAERTIRIKASFFFLSFENNRTDRWTLMRRGDRLIATRHEEEEVTSGFTRSVSINAVTTLVID